jgi:hypothetical protein
MRKTTDHAPAWQCPACGIAYAKHRAYLARARQVVTPLRAADDAPDWTFDGSIWSLIGANLLAIGTAIYEGWGASSLMAVYWAQSVVIGIANFFRLLALDRFSTKDFRINNRSVEPTPAIKRQVAFFFAAHYGLFHTVYFLFLIADSHAALFPPWFWICVAAFAANHFWSYRYNRDLDRHGTPNIGTLMFTPYIRIVPMHLAIIFGALLADTVVGLLLFGVLKTVADVVMHIVEHRQLKKVREAA